MPTPHVVVRHGRYATDRTFDTLDAAIAAAKRYAITECIAGDVVSVVRARSRMKAGTNSYSPARHLKAAPVFMIDPDAVRYVSRRDARWAACAMLDDAPDAVLYVCEIAASVAVRITTRVL